MPKSHLFVKGKDAQPEAVAPTASGFLVCIRIAQATGLVRDPPDNPGCEHQQEGGGLCIAIDCGVPERIEQGICFIHETWLPSGATASIRAGPPRPQGIETRWPRNSSPFCTGFSSAT